MSMFLTLPVTCLAFFSVSVRLDFPCTAHAFFLERLSNHCQGLHRTSSETARNLMLFLCRIHHEIASGQITRLQIKWCENQQIQPAKWNLVHLLPRYVNTIIYRYIALLQLLYWWQHQSRKLWTPVVNSYIVGRTLRASTARECQLAGALSPLLWSLVVYKLLWDLNDNGHYIVG
jgi:hypothetical protein